MSPRQSAAVYRRRRIVVLGIIIVLIALLIVLVWALVGRGAPGADPKPAPTTSSTPSSTASAPPATPDPGADASPDPAATTPGPTSTAGAGPVPCTAAEVQVTAVADHDSYSADENPKLSITLTNSSAKDCTMNVGTTTQAFTITSGNDTWWRSTDCQQTPSDAVQTIKAGATITSSTPVVWDRTRSSVDTCEATDRQRAPGGGAAYRLTVSIGGFQSTNPVQFLLN